MSENMFLKILALLLVVLVGVCSVTLIKILPIIFKVVILGANVVTIYFAYKFITFLNNKDE
jgi:hypothetical protein